MALHKSMQLWTIVLLGLFYISIQCDARAVNVSNTWTMPQEGLNVFYRFFRDRISWFEADAVCQFHHANLVTVDNSFQFDATRDLLRELDVNDIVWIGLMRPQSSERFMWSNSHPLVADTGYWAESLPLMDAPLCAVIDPIRDYRWHALRCGGPETASFLCEMPVPSWADACILKDMPNLTMQYMADTASIELIRNCEEEGLLRQTCKGKQDRENAIRELICPKERLEAQRINDITNSHFKSLQIINSIRTDNNENNDIELLPMGPNYEANGDFAEQQVQTEKNTVQRLIEQFNVDELMQADEPTSRVVYKIPGEIPLPVKKTAKKVIVAREYPKKEAKQQKSETQKQRKQQVLALDDMMMGDQPQGEPELPEHTQDDDVSNEIMEPLPHRKKILPQDLKTMATITEQPLDKLTELEKKLNNEDIDRQALNKQTEISSAVVLTTTVPAATTKASAAAITTTATTATTTTTAATMHTTTTTTAATTTAPTTVAITSEDTFATAETSLGTTTNAAAAGSNYPTSIAPPTATVPPATIGHPMHPQQPRSNVITEETQHPHIKESADNSHFIPPMLLVKSHYVPPAKHGEHGAAEHHGQHEDVEHVAVTTRKAVAAATSTTIEAFNTGSGAESSEENTSSSTGKVTTAVKHDELLATSTVSSAIGGVTTDTHAAIIDDSAKQQSQVVAAVPEVLEGGIKRTTILKPITEMASNKTKIENLSGTITAATTTAATTTTAAAAAQVGVHTATSTRTTTAEAVVVATTTVTPVTATKAAHLEAAPATTLTTTTRTAATQKPEVSAATASSSTTTTTQAEIQKIQTETSAALPAEKQETIAAATDAPATTTTTRTTTTTTTARANSAILTATITTASAETTYATATEAPTPTRNFLKDETEAPFKPNRRRSLTKPEAVSYFKKILG